MNSDEMKVVLELLGEIVLDRFTDRVRDICNRKDPEIRYFTPHAASHFAGVERAIERLLAMQRTDATAPPSAAEKLVLRFCCWGHDVGMVREVNKDFHDQQNSERTPEWSPAWARKHHDEASSYFVTRQMEEIGKEITADYKIVENLQYASRRQATNDSALERQKDLVERYAARGYSEQVLKLLVAFLSAEENHDSISAHIDGLANTVALIASFHRRQKKIEQCPVHREVLGVTVRAKFLAAAFRLADALHVDRSRFSSKHFERIRYESDFSAEARRHWMKSYLVSSISIDTTTHSLDVQMDLPEPLNSGEDEALPSPLVATTGTELDRKRHAIAGMRDFILNDLEEDLFSVSSILLEHSFPPILKVMNHVHVVPSMGAYFDEILSALDDLNISASPNTSQVMSAALASFKDIYTEAKGREEELLKAARLRLEGLREMLDKRRCHEGVNKIKALLQAIVTIFAREPVYEKRDGRKKSDSIAVSKEQHNLAVDGLTATQYIIEDKFLLVCLEGAYTTFKEQRQRCKEVVQNGDLDESFRVFEHASLNVIVYGYSEQVIEVMRRLFSKLTRMPTIHVLECRTKTQYTPTGRLIYHDGIRFASAIRDEFSKVGLSKTGKECPITLIPDFAIGRILEESCQSNKHLQNLVLLGSNAVTLDGHLVHSMGHATVAAIAKSPRYAHKTQVWVLTDSLKMGGYIEQAKRNETSERNKGQWLSHDGRALEAADRKKITTTNWQEDLVAVDHIDHILVLDKAQKIDTKGQNTSKEIKELEFKPDLEFNQKLHVRVVASTVRAHFQTVADHSDLFDRIAESELMPKDKRLLDVDHLCYTLAELALKETLGKLDSKQPKLTQVRVDHGAWREIVAIAKNGCRPDLKDGISKFTMHLSKVYRKVRDLPEPEPEPEQAKAASA